MIEEEGKGGRLTRCKADMRTVIKDLATLTWPSWLCLIVAAISALASIYAWLPWSEPANHWSVYMIILALVPWSLGAMSLIGQSLISRKHRKSASTKTSLPVSYWYLFAFSAAYFAVLFFGMFIYYPHNVYLGPSVNLRVAAAFALIFSVVSLGFTHWSELRSQRIQADISP